jgi:hypothetical protein
MRAAVSKRWDAARREWNSNPRLRWGGLAILVIVFAYACLLLLDWRAALQEQYRQRSLQLYKMAALSGQNQWLLRAESAKTVQKALRAEIPDASSIGLAQAEAQTTVRQILNAFGPKLSADPRPPAQVRGQPGVWRFPIAIRGPVSQPQLASILWRIEGSDRLIVIDELAITFVQRTPSVAMTVTAYYRVATPAGTGNARP